MAEITFVTGGQRSGKSSFSQRLAEEKSESPIYLATARIWDDDFKRRVERHKSDRDENWQIVEEEFLITNPDRFLSSLPMTNKKKHNQSKYNESKKVPSDNVCGYRFRCR